ncbi:pyridoxamine 5'-phosphate oxidase family protein [Nocardia nova]|uniref:pyridoxamine 5'-phosphate oxidase family protein n=1 Tax=Nocardia nova TaxID=37330 RepID=UPI0037209E3D
MNPEVKTDELARVIADYDLAHLVTIGDNSLPRVVPAHPVPQSGRLHVAAPGSHTRDNVAARPAVSLVWAPREPTGYSLIVDGLGTMEDDQLVIAPTRAILHRVAPPGQVSAEGECGNDCRVIPL